MPAPAGQNVGLHVVLDACQALVGAGAPLIGRKGTCPGGRCRQAFGQDHARVALDRLHLDPRGTRHAQEAAQLRNVAKAGLAHLESHK